MIPATMTASGRTEGTSRAVQHHDHHVTRNREVKLFAGEAEATRWLDARARDDQAKPRAT